ncbi:MAG: lipoprotein [Burkholderiaceae bacterium]|nr:lipoprotein [Burkholderiaceae bacterium]
MIEMKRAVSVASSAAADRVARWSPRRVIALGLFPLLLGACGQKGPLYLPPAAAAPTDRAGAHGDITTASPAAAASAAARRATPQR